MGKKCKECKYDQGSHCTVDDEFHEYTGDLTSWSGKDKNEKGECPKFEDVKAA